MLKRCLVALALLVCSSYSYSEQVYGTTTNAAAFGLNWVMTNILPQQAGLTVDGVVYRYTTVKEQEWDMLVHVQNENALGDGYIFRETDDWSGRPSNTINRLVPVASIPIQYWGDGSIEVEGEGEVKDATVLYSYQYDPCFDPQVDPECPGYVPPITYEIVEVEDPMDDELIKEELEKESEVDNEDEEDKDRKKVMVKEKKQERLQAILGIVDNSIMAATDAAKHAELTAMNILPTSYMSIIPDGKYEETVVLKDANLPDNVKGRRANFAQQLLHEQMVDLQYDN